MNITFFERSKEVYFKISDFDAKYEPVLKMCFYQKEGQYYFKKYPKETIYMDKIKSYFKEHAEEMFDQLGYFSEIPWEDALLWFIQKVKDTNINWWLTGSCAACIRGIPFKPHDVDIMVDSKDVPLLNELFQDYLMEPILDTDGWVTKDFGVIFKYARIDIASDPSPILDESIPVDCGPYAKAHLETICFKGHKIKVPPLKLQLNANKLRNRHERVRIIEDNL